MFFENERLEYLADCHGIGGFDLGSFFEEGRNLVRNLALRKEIEFSCLGTEAILSAQKIPKESYISMNVKTIDDWAKIERLVEKWAELKHNGIRVDLKTRYRKVSDDSDNGLIEKPPLTDESLGPSVSKKRKVIISPEYCFKSFLKFMCF